MGATAALPRSDHYDAIIVGSGLGGLSAAACLGASGRRTLVVERLDHAGGYAAAFRRGDYLIDPAIHMLALGERHLLRKILRYLGVEDQVEFRPTGGFYEARFPGATINAAVGRDAYVESHTAVFGREAEAGVRAYLKLARRMHEEVHQLPPALSLKELEEAVKRFPTLFTYRGATLGDILEQCVPDPRVRAALGASWPFFGLPPAQLSFFTWSTPLTTLVEEGPFQAVGSTQALVDALVTGVERNGGELVFGRAVERILVEDGRAAGVVLADGDTVRAPVVVSNADARVTFHDLVGPEHLPASFLKRLDRKRVALSAILLFAGTDLDLHAAGVDHTTFVNEDWSHENAHAGVLEGRPGGTWLSVPSLSDPGLAPAGHHVLVFTGMATPGMPADRDAYVDHVLALYEGVIDGLREHLTFLEVATPKTLAHFAGNADGPIYGWENSPANAGSRRLHHFTPLPGLFACGHWTQPGSGGFRTIFSGVETTLTVLGAGYADEFLRNLDLGGD